MIKLSISYIKSGFNKVVKKGSYFIGIFLKFIVLGIILIAGHIMAQGILESSNLPIVIINTNGQAIPDRHKITVDMGIIYNGPGERNYVSDSLNHYNGKIGIELRGSSSQQFPKQQFAVETRDEAGENLNVSLLGLPEENDWILYAPYSDKSLMRNVLLYELSNEIGQYASRSRFCELVLNGDYKGVYVLFEKIKRDKNRVDISELNPDEITGDDLTGGYIIKIDKRDGEEVAGWYSNYRPYSGSSNYIYYQYHYPRPDDIITEQKDYIQEYFDNFEEMMYSWDYDDPETGYASLIDVSSFVDFFLLNEISKNVDGYRLSTYFYKDKDSDDPKLYAGPVWDFNLAFGNADYYDGWKTMGWQVKINKLSGFKSDVFKVPFYWDRFMNDRDFLIKVAERWSQLHSGPFSLENLYGLIDDYADDLDESQQRNFERWPVLGSYVWPNYYVGDTYADEITFLKGWIYNRLIWMDEMLLDTVPPDTVRNLHTIAVSNTSFTIDWDDGYDNAAISGYDVFLDGNKVNYAAGSECTVDGLEQSKNYQVEVKTRDYAGNYSIGNPVISVYITGLPGSKNNIPANFKLYQNYPNPFNPTTTISYYLPINAFVIIKIFDMNGQEVIEFKRGTQLTGRHKVDWNGKDQQGNDVASGVYIYQMVLSNNIHAKKMILIH